MEMYPVARYTLDTAPMPRKSIAEHGSAHHFRKLFLERMPAFKKNIRPSACVVRRAIATRLVSLCSNKLVDSPVGKPKAHPEALQ